VIWFVICPSLIPVNILEPVLPSCQSGLVAKYETHPSDPTAGDCDDFDEVERVDDDDHDDSDLLGD